LAAGVSDVTATATEINNAADLSGLTAGWVYSADTATTASWKAQSGGGTVDVVSNVATARILGRTSAGSGDSEELTDANVRDFLFNDKSFTDTDIAVSDQIPFIDATDGDLKFDSVTSLTAGLASDKTCMALESPVDADNKLFWRTDVAITVTGIDCISEDATSTVITVQECNGDGNSCAATEAAMTCGVTNTAHAATIDDAAIDAGDWMRVDIGTVTGTPGQVNVCMYYDIP
jgi:hypothetical protein